MSQLGEAYAWRRRNLATPRLWQRLIFGDVSTWRRLILATPALGVVAMPGDSYARRCLESSSFVPLISDLTFG